MSGISMRFGATQALKNMQLNVRAGEIHALIGENGAGKSTLMKVLSGMYQPNAGQILLDGKPVTIRSPAEGRSCGINLIYQELSIATNLTVAENVFMGHEPRLPFFRVDRAQMRRATTAVLELLGAAFSADTPASRLSIAEQQQVEIARALVHQGRILIMDEPTAALSDRETDHLFAVVRKLRDEGIAVIYISHRMAEINELADRVTVLRDGGFVGELARDEIRPELIVRMMVGRPLDDFYPHGSARTPGRVVLDVTDLSGGKVKPSSLQVRAGEVVGLAGLVGAGRTELARLIFGADPRSGGSVRLDGEGVYITEPLDAMRLGIGYVPEDRKGQGLFLQLSALINVTINVAGRNACASMLNHAALNRLMRAATQRLDIRLPGPESIVGSLSGGNQQKVLLARWLEIHPRVLILDEPTRGVDVGAKSEIYRIVHQLADQGVAILVISSELPEVIGICDRVVVMHEGEVVGEVSGDRLTQEHIMSLATNVAHPAEALA